MENTERYQMLVESVCEEHDCLTKKQIEKLGELLKKHFNTRSDDYKTVVNFLYSTEEIDLATKLDLLDLA